MPQVVNLTESDEEQEAADVIDLAEDTEPQAVVTTAQDAANTVRTVPACVGHTPRLAELLVAHLGPTWQLCPH